MLLPFLFSVVKSDDPPNRSTEWIVESSGISTIRIFRNCPSPCGYRRIIDDTEYLGLISPFRIFDVKVPGGDFTIGEEVKTTKVRKKVRRHHFYQYIDYQLPGAPGLQEISFRISSAIAGSVFRADISDTNFSMIFPRAVSRPTIETNYSKNCSWEVTDLGVNGYCDSPHYVNVSFPFGPFYFGPRGGQICVLVIEFILVVCAGVLLGVVFGFFRTKECGDRPSLDPYQASKLLGSDPNQRCLLLYLASYGRVILGVDSYGRGTVTLPGMENYTPGWGQIYGLYSALNAELEHPPPPEPFLSGLLLGLVRALIPMGGPLLGLLTQFACAYWTFLPHIILIAWSLMFGSVAFLLVLCISPQSCAWIYPVCSAVLQGVPPLVMYFVSFSRNGWDAIQMTVFALIGAVAGTCLNVLYIFSSEGRRLAREVFAYGNTIRLWHPEDAAEVWLYLAYLSALGDSKCPDPQQNGWLHWGPRLVQ
jgi:hypothetical protein